MSPAVFTDALARWLAAAAAAASASDLRAFAAGRIGEIATRVWSPRTLAAMEMSETSSSLSLPSSFSAAAT